MQTIGARVGVLVVGALLFFANSASGDGRADWAEPIKITEGAEKTLQTGVERVLLKVEQAQSKSDVLLLNCLNEKLGQLQGLLKVVQDARAGLRSSVANENNDLSEHHFNKVEIAKEQGAVILAEADACAGAGTTGNGQGTNVVVTITGDKTGDDGFGASPAGSTRTPEASPRE